MSVFLLYISLVLVLSGLAVVVMLWLRRRIGTETLRRNHEVAGFVYSVVGAIFAVTVALMVDTVHDEYIAGERCAASEAVQVGTLYHLAEWFPEQGGKQLQLDLKKYVQAVVGPEWVRMMQPENRSAPEAETAFHEVSESLRLLRPLSLQQQAAYAEMIQRFSALREYRYTRLFGKRYEMPFPLWFTVILGGTITIGFTLFFSMHSTRAQGLMVFVISALIWSNIVVISEVQYPFNGLSNAPPRAMLQLLQRVQ